ncbi:MAG TPA: sulfatase-like hydrolase/transferase, partial [Aggregatilineales bacterium]|nr:sulfatase-like hydrolase/transferase [Aggregatilineales bacterium]
KEIYNPGYGGLDNADQVIPIALDWLDRCGREDNWFLHVNLWDPHTPYSVPEAFGHPFKEQALPAWLTEEVRQTGWNGYGPHSPQEPNGFGREAPHALYPRQPNRLDSMAAVRAWVDGYDTGILYADMWLARLLDKLESFNLLEETVIMIGADHGENLGELNIWGDHQTADQITCRVPLIVRWPGQVNARVDTALHYHVDWGATLVKLLGGQVPANWDGISFAEAFRNGVEQGRPYLVTSQGAWSCQRGVRFDFDGDTYIALRTYHDGYKQLEPLTLYNLRTDPHEQNNLVAAHPDLIRIAMSYLEDWWAAMMQSSLFDVDPLMTVLREGGPHHTQGQLLDYLQWLRATGRTHHAEHLQTLHPNEKGLPEAKV